MIKKTELLSERNRTQWRKRIVEAPRKACKGRLRITADGQMIEQQGHDHVVNLGNVQAKIAVTEIRRRAANSRDTPRMC